MKYILITMMAALLLSANALAAIKIDARQARNMDDVQSLGVIYINHNIATEQEADQALSQQSDAQGAKYFQLGASVIIIGIIEGVAEATALILKVFSGVISDYVGKRKGLALLGYGLGALSKPLFAIAPTSGVVFSARMIDRVGKGIRGAPRDALVADVTPPEIRGAAYGPASAKPFWSCAPSRWRSRCSLFRW